MSLLSAFIAGHVVNALEASLLAHEPELQEAFLGEVSQFVNTLSGWIHDKLEAKGDAENG